MFETPTSVAQPTAQAAIGDVVAFWCLAGLDAWFRKDRAFDLAFKERFLAAHFAAAAREYDTWANSPEGLLALLILLDQFPRNAFRGTAHMFATDALARMFARRGLAAGYDKMLTGDCRLIFYLPLTHSENLADQELSLKLRRTLGPRLERRAEEHRDIIRRYGRFPHRNALLGRESTQEEAEFLLSGGFSG
jgi:uncharacterized protein (DUF924 family)